MFYCVDCEEFFEEPSLEEEHVAHSELTEHGITPCEVNGYWICPLCGGDDVHEAGICKLCGEPTKESYEDLCDNCRTDLISMFKDMIEKAAKKYEKPSSDVYDAFWDATEGYEF